MTTTAIVLLAFVALLFLGIPVAFVLGISSVFYCLVTEQLPFLYIVSHRMFGGIDNFVLMAIPLFMLAGEIMSRGDVSRRLVDLAEELVGRFRGGLGYVNVLASTFFRRHHGVRAFRYSCRRPHRDPHDGGGRI